MRKIIIELAHDLLKKYVNKDDIVIDATMGNGNDTIALAKLAKHVYAFDIQDEAINITKEKIKGFKNITLIKDSFVNIYNYISDFKGIVFNLGYLPKGDKSITTKAIDTINIFKILVKNLKLNQFMLFVIYPGHEEGKKGSIALLKEINNLDASFKILKSELLNQVNNPPYILFIKKANENIF